MPRLIYLLLLLPISPASATDVVPLGIGIFPGILSPPGVQQSVMGIRISPLVGIHRDVYGIDMGLVNVALGHEKATQVGIVNYQGKRMTIFGLQLGGLINWNAGNVHGFGLQMASLLNKNTDSGYFFGLQGALWNLSPRTNLYGASLGLLNRNGYLRGFQVGLVNQATDLGGLQLGITAQSDTIWGIQSGLLVSRARRIRGFQISLVNVADQVSGFQLGLVNRAGSLMGIQIGLININTGGKVPFLPLINVGI